MLLRRRETEKNCHEHDGKNGCRAWRQFVVKATNEAPEVWDE